MSDHSGETTLLSTNPKKSKEKERKKSNILILINKYLLEYQMKNCHKRSNISPVIKTRLTF